GGGTARAAPARRLRRRPRRPARLHLRRRADPDPPRAARRGGADVPPPMIEARGISKRYGGLTVLSEVALSVPRGGILGLIGPNVAAKPTLFNVLPAFVRPDAGKVVFDGRDITPHSP